MSVFDRRPALRWTIPAATAALIVAGSALGPLGAAADDGLPPRTAEELLVALQQAEPVPLSGTVVTTADLGLPELPMSGERRAEMSDLLSGDSTLRVWTDGADRSRVALLATSAEAVLVRDGREAWAWSSADNAAEHWLLPEPTERTDGGLPISPDDLPATPQEAAEQVLAMLDETTEVTTSGVGTVAGRSVYELVLDPRQGDTLVDRVTIATDAETGVPLRVRVHSTQLASPAFEVAFRSVDFAEPDPALFTFSPPAGATVTEHDAPTQKPGAPEERADGAEGFEEPTVVGQGWSTVVVAELGADPLAALASGAEPGEPGPADQAASALALLESLPTTSGAWGTGRVLAGTLFSAILTDDGRLAVGMVGPEALGAALAQ